MEPGSCFDRYVLLADLKPRVLPRAEGAPARTFLALDRETGEVVAVQAAMVASEVADVFMENCRRTRSAELPGSPTLLAAGYHSGHAFVTHQWVSGVSFREILQVVAPREELARVLAVETARCLAQLHGHELVHGDIHPDNLLLRNNGRLFLVGHMPRPLGHPASSIGPTCQVARYTAPEILDGEAPGASSDVFSTGLVAFELFSGQRLLRNASAEDLRMDLEILDPSLEVLLEKHAALTPPVRSVLARCLRFSPESRFGSGVELLDDLLGQAPVAQAEPRENLLRGLVSLVPPQVTRQIYLHIREAIEAQDLPRAIHQLWRYSNLVPGSDRTRARSGYLATMEALWLCLLCGAGGEVDRGTAAAAAYLLHRLARTWGSRTLRLLATELTYRFTDEGSRLRELLGDPPISEAKAREAAARFRADLEARPRSGKALLGLTVFTREFHAERGETLGGLKARMLAHHGLYRSALFYRCRDILDQVDASGVLEDVSDLLMRVRAGAAVEEVARATEALAPPTDAGTFDFSAVVSQAQEARQARLEARAGQPAEDIDKDDTDTSAGFDLSSPGTLPGLAALGAGGADDPDSSSPTAMNTLESPSGPPLSSPLNDAQELFDEGAERARAGDVGASAGAFHTLLGSGVLQREFYYSGVCSELRGLLWLLLLRPGAPARADIRALWELAVEADLVALLPLCEHLLAVAYADIDHRDEEIAEVERLVTRRPGSYLLRQIAAAQVLARQENFRWAEHLVAAAEDRLEARDLVTAAKLLMAARSAAVMPAIDQAHGRMMSLAEHMADAGGALADLLQDLAVEPDAVRAYAAIAALAERFPGHEPTLEELARRARAAGYGSRASDVLMDLGRARMLREDFPGARRSFCEVLECEFENDEALLYLAALGEPGEPLPQDLDLVRPTILAAEGLFEAGIHRALQALDGSRRDVALRELLIDMSSRAGRDPSRHRVGLAILALGDGELERCRELCDQAFTETKDPGQLVEILTRVPGIDLVYSRVELAQRRS